MCSRQALCRAGTHTAGHIHPTAGNAHPTARTLQGTPLHGMDPQLLPTERPSPGHSTSPPFVPWALLSQECISASYKASHKVKLPKSPKTLRNIHNHETQRRGAIFQSKTWAILCCDKRVQFCSFTLTEQFENWGAEGWSGTRNVTAGPYFIFFKTMWVEYTCHTKC